MLDFEVEMKSPLAVSSAPNRSNVWEWITMRSLFPATSLRHRPMARPSTSLRRRLTSAKIVYRSDHTAYVGPLSTQQQQRRKPNISKQQLFISVSITRSCPRTSDIGRPPPSVALQYCVVYHICIALDQMNSHAATVARKNSLA